MNKSIAEVCAHCDGHPEGGPFRNHHDMRDRGLGLGESHSSGISIGGACRRYTCHSEVGPCRNHRCKEGRRIACMCTCQSAARCAELCVMSGSLPRAATETSTQLGFACVCNYACCSTKRNTCTLRVSNETMCSPMLPMCILHTTSHNLLVTDIHNVKTYPSYLLARHRDQVILILVPAY